MNKNFPAPTPEEKALYDSGDRIAAIRMYRERNHGGLAEAYCALNGITAEQHEANHIDPKYRNSANR